MTMTRRSFVQKGAITGTAIAFLPMTTIACGDDESPEDQTIVTARIHPAIGIARVGNAENEF